MKMPQYKSLIWLSIVIIVSFLVWGLFILSGIRDGKLHAISTPLTYANSYQFPDNHVNSAVKLVLFGDSRIQDWSFEWPNNVSVVNAGIGGSTVFQSLQRLDRDVILLQPDWVVIQVGINDVVASRMVLGKARQEVMENTAVGLVSLAQRLRNANISVVFMTIPPSIKPDLARQLFWQGDLQSSVVVLNHYLLENLPKDVIIVDAYGLFQNNKGEWREDFIEDPLHWTRDAYSSLSLAILEIINRR